MAKPVIKKKKKDKIKLDKGVVNIISTYNNTIISVADLDGKVISWSSPGVIGYKGSKKSTAYAATKAAEDAIKKAVDGVGLKEVLVVVKGAGLGRQAAVKGVKSSGIRITSLSDRTPIPHNGCRPKKRPRGS